MSDQDQGRLVAIITHQLDSLAAAGTPWRAQWIAHAIVNEHCAALDDDHEDAWFWRKTSYAATREAVRKEISRRAGDDSQKKDRPQLDLPGFDREHLQDYYVVRRDGDDIGVPVTALTDQEIDSKADLYESMARACSAHADELRRFKAWRTDLLRDAESS